MHSLFGNLKLISRANLTPKFSNWRILQMNWTCLKTRMISYDSVLIKLGISSSDKIKNWRTSKRLQSKPSKMPTIRYSKLWRELDCGLSALFFVKSFSDRLSKGSRDTSISRGAKLPFLRECLCPAARNGGRSSQSTSMITSIKRQRRSYLVSLKSIKRSIISSLSKDSCRACSSCSATSRKEASSNGFSTKTNRTWDGEIPGSPLKFGNLIWLANMQQMMPESTAIFSDEKDKTATWIT